MSGSSKRCVDHLGKEFESITAMCRYWGVEYSTFTQRRQSGYDLCGCLTGRGVKAFNSRVCKDHLGQKFRTKGDMCRHWGITEYMLTGRRSRGHNLRSCLTGEGLLSHNKIYIDHLGNRFKTIECMCDYWNVEPSIFNARREKGYHIKVCLLGTADTTGLCVDHLGKVFKSEQEMCEYWKVSYDLYMNRVKSGCDLKTSLLGAITHKKGNTKPCLDHLGVEFESVSEMCKHWGIDRGKFYWRCSHGYNLEQALTGVNPKVAAGVAKCKDHNNNEFDNVKEMCRAYGVKYTTYLSRLRDGHNLEESLTGVGLLTRGGGLKCTDHEGREFNSVVDMCRYWKVHRTTFIARQEAGHDLETCLTGKGIKSSNAKKSTSKHKKTVKDHRGKEFETYAEMCIYWGVKYSTFVTRKQYGYDTRTCLTWDKFGPIAYADHTGRSFNSLAEMCHYHMVDPQQFKLRRKMGYSVEAALNNELFGEQPYQFEGLDPAIDAMVKSMVGFRDLADNKSKNKHK